MAAGNYTPIDEAMGRKLRKWEAENVPRREMSRRTGVSRYLITRYLGKKPPKESGPRRPEHHLYAYNKPFQKAAAIAKRHGYLLGAGDNAGQGSVGRLIEAIGDGEVRVISGADLDYLESCRFRLESLEH
jgi:hypothetical protein